MLDGVELTVAPGAVFGLLGPEPARPRSCESWPPCSRRTAAPGHDVAREADAVRDAIGVTGHFSAVDGLPTGRENLEPTGDLHHPPRAAASASCSSASSSSTRPTGLR
ncbi:MAG TPA: hypothetical protein VHX88_02720 [Solirubrobacteraceae bacterium]|nr:hypothetical protein [Solirubrobacteraceae bacterium]